MVRSRCGDLATVGEVGKGVAVGTLLSVIAGGAIATGGSWVAEVIRGRDAAKTRRDGRRADARDFRRVKVQDLVEATNELRQVLIEYQHALTGGGDLTELDLRRSRWDGLVVARIYQVDDSQVQNRVKAWREAATAWVNDEDTKRDEEQAWEQAMTACGRETIDTISET